MRTQVAIGDAELAHGREDRVHPLVGLQGRLLDRIGAHFDADIGARHVGRRLGLARTEYGQASGLCAIGRRDDRVRAQPAKAKLAMSAANGVPWRSVRSMMGSPPGNESSVGGRQPAARTEHYARACGPQRSRPAQARFGLPGSAAGDRTRPRRGCPAYSPGLFEPSPCDNDRAMPRRPRPGTPCCSRSSRASATCR